MKSCELCKSAAKIYCDSDQASLCWTCDRKVHSANFLVARHTRCLLCRVCQSLTPWTASGEKLGPSTASICEKCVVVGHVNCTTVDDEHDGGEESHDDNEEYDGDDTSENEIEVEEEDEDDNQVVPLSYTPPPAASSSSCGDYSVSDSVLLKRKRENVADLSFEDDCFSMQMNHCMAESSKPIEVNRGTLYNFLPLNAEAMGEKKMKMKMKSGVGIDLNSSDC